MSWALLGFGGRGVTDAVVTVGGVVLYRRPRRRRKEAAAHAPQCLGERQAWAFVHGMRASGVR